MTKRFQDRVVFITGAGSGIGLETALRFRDMGYAVLGVGRDKAKLEALEKQFANKDQIAILSADVMADWPPGVVTLTSTVPATRAGAVTVISVSDVASNVVAAVPPTLMAVTPSRLVPVTVMTSPSSGTRTGSMALTVGTP